MHGDEEERLIYFWYLDYKNSKAKVKYWLLMEYVWAVINVVSVYVLKKSCRVRNNRRLKI